MGRGSLRIYLGMAPGVGKTYAMLSDARRARDRGTDVVVGLVETHGRRPVGELLDGLEVLRRRPLRYRGAEFGELDVDAVLARRPRQALVDELAHTNVPGARNAKRHQDVEELLAAGIDVVTTLNVAHLESLGDVVERITGVPQRETIPDAVVRAAGQIELVDMAPEALRRRLAHGNVYPPELLDAALSHYFRAGNLNALRELALLWLAGRVDEALRRYRSEHDIEAPWETRERVVVALTGGPESDTLIRRAARIAARSGGGELLAVHVARANGPAGGTAGGLAGADPTALARLRDLTERLGGAYHQVAGDDPAAAVLAFARAESATQIVIGASRRGRLVTFLTGEGVSARVVRESGPIDVHLVTHPHAAGHHRHAGGPSDPGGPAGGGNAARPAGAGGLAGPAGAGGLARSGGAGGGSLPTRDGGLTPRRRVQAAVAGLALLSVLTAVLVPLRADLNLSSRLLLYLLAVVVTGLVGGRWPALGAAVLAMLLVNFFFTEPLYTLSIAARDNVIALVVFVAVAAAVAWAVDRAAERTRQAARATAEARTLAALAGGVLRGERGVPALLERVRDTFGLTGVAFLERTADGWRTARSAGDAPNTPGQADVAVRVGDRFVLAGTGRILPAADRRVLDAFALHAAAAMEQGRLAEQAGQAEGLAAADRIRTALLRAVSHDLRSPLASAKAAVSSLRGDDVAWSAEETAELLATADESLDRLNRLVDNLLDMSRLQAGALSVSPAPVGLDEVAVRAVDSLGPEADHVRVRAADDLPAALADPVLAERVVANLVANAIRYSPDGRPPLVTVSHLGSTVELRVIDHGPGIPPSDRDRVFTPFQRLGDRGTGVGLGLALSRGLAEAMSGRLTPEDTPGGGLTMVLTVPVAGAR